MKKTNAARLLDKLKSEYEIREYEVDETDLSAGNVAGKVGLPLERVFKTLVARGDKTGVIMAVVAGGAELDLKALAAKDRAAQAADRLETLLRRLEGQAQDLRGRVQNDLVPEAEKKVKENLLMSLAIALGFGLLLGLLLGSSGRGR